MSEPIESPALSQTPQTVSVVADQQSVAKDSSYTIPDTLAAPVPDMSFKGAIPDTIASPAALDAQAAAQSRQSASAVVTDAVAASLQEPAYPDRENLIKEATLVRAVREDNACPQNTVPFDDHIKAAALEATQLMKDKVFPQTEKGTIDFYLELQSLPIAPCATPSAADSPQQTSPQR